MKRSLIVCFLCFIVIDLYSQAISRFLDFRLGMPISEARYILNSKYRSAEWNGNECKITGVQLAGEQFSQLVLTFSNNQLVSGTFAALNSPIITFNQNEFRQRMEYQLNSQQQRIARLYSQFSSKYGNASSSSDTSITWRDSFGNSITINILLNNSYNYDSYIGNVNVNVKYSSQQDNF